MSVENCRALDVAMLQQTGTRQCRLFGSSAMLVKTAWLPPPRCQLTFSRTRPRTTYLVTTMILWRLTPIRAYRRSIEQSAVNVTASGEQNVVRGVVHIVREKPIIIVSISLAKGRSGDHKSHKISSQHRSVVSEKLTKFQHFFRRLPVFSLQDATVFTFWRNTTRHIGLQDDTNISIELL